MRTVTVVGVGADGWAGLSTTARAAIESAQILMGGDRHLSLIPDHVAGQRIPWPRPLRQGLSQLLRDHQDHTVVALASGDPMLSGVGTTLVDLLGASAVTVIPAVSSAALARARMGWSAESSSVISLTAASVDVIRRHLSPSARLVVLGADRSTARQVADVLIGAEASDAVVDLWSRLGSTDEQHHQCTPAQVPNEIDPLTIICVSCPPDLQAYSLVGGLPDEAFEHDGQLTKRDLRASALARLAPHPGQLLWDVGAGAGSVGIEWMRAHPRMRATSIEANAVRAQRITRNAALLGVPGLQVVEGSAPSALKRLEPPDAIFIGGGLTRAGVLPACLDALRPGSRLVAHAVTVESELLLASAQHDHGGELVRVQVETAEPLGSMRGWRPARAVTQWSMTR